MDGKDISNGYLHIAVFAFGFRGDILRHCLQAAHYYAYQSISQSNHVFLEWHKYLKHC